MSLDRVTAAIASAARRIDQSDASLDATLETIAVAARDSIPGFDLAGISTVDAEGNATTWAVSDPLVFEFDKVQYSLGEGPCLDALGVSHVVSVPRIRHDQRWPRYVPQVVQMGLRSQLAVKVGLGDDTGARASINMYSTISDEIEPEAEPIAELFAIHVAATLGYVIKIDQLNQGIQTRKVIGQAIGILMERYGIPEDNAFQFLVRASQTDNIKVRVIAQRLVDQINGPRDDDGRRRHHEGTAPPG
jgi:hypothetical protein